MHCRPTPDRNDQGAGPARPPGAQASDRVADSDRRLAVPCQCVTVSVCDCVSLCQARGARGPARLMSHLIPNSNTCSIMRTTRWFRAQLLPRVATVPLLRIDPNLLPAASPPSRYSWLRPATVEPVRLTVGGGWVPVVLCACTRLTGGQAHWRAQRISLASWSCLVCSCAEPSALQVAAAAAAAAAPTPHTPHKWRRSVARC